MVQSENGLLAVLIHEIGHFAGRHAWRTLIQDAMLGFVLLAITGDASGSWGLFLDLPVRLTERRTPGNSKWSRMPFWEHPCRRRTDSVPSAFGGPWKACSVFDRIEPLAVPGMSNGFTAQAPSTG